MIILTLGVSMWSEFGEDTPTHVAKTNVYDHRFYTTYLPTLIDDMYGYNVVFISMLSTW